MNNNSLFALGFIALFASGCAFDSEEQAPPPETASAEAEEGTPILYPVYPIHPTYPVYPIQLRDDTATTAAETSFDDVEPSLPEPASEDNSFDDVEPSSPETTADENAFDAVAPSSPETTSDEDDIQAKRAPGTTCTVQYLQLQTGEWVVVPCG